MTDSLPRSLRTAGSFGLLLAALFFGYPQSASGQIWLQTARVVTPVEDGPMRVFLDSLVNVMERKDITVQRSPEEKEKMKIADLRSALINEQGIGLGSANHAFINYRFTIDNGSNFEQEITNIYFVFRPGPDQSDIPVMYVNAREAWVQKLLNQKGTSLRTNEAALIPFQRHLGFANIARKETSDVVEISGETVREKFDEEKEALIRKIERLMYETYV